MNQGSTMEEDFLKQGQSVGTVSTENPSLTPMTLHWAHQATEEGTSTSLESIIPLKSYSGQISLTMSGYGLFSSAVDFSFPFSLFCGWD